jgi:hypothetical protein
VPGCLFVADISHRYFLTRLNWVRNNEQESVEGI